MQLFSLTLDRMTLRSVETRDRERVMNLFGVEQVPDRLEELRLPAGSFRTLAAQALLDAGLVRYRTETGIACQGPDEWEIVLTDRGMGVLRSGTCDESSRLD